MCRCKYPKIIKRNNINIIEDEEGDRCYKVTFKIKEEGNNILIISRAPKRIGSSTCDCEYKRIIKFLKKNEDYIGEIKTITIVNLYAVYELSREDLYLNFLRHGKYYIEGNDEIVKNDDIIIKAIEENDFIFCGWGDGHEGMDQQYTNRVEKILKFIRKGINSSNEKKEIFKVGEESKKGAPRHCLGWGYNDEIKRLFQN